VAGSGGLGMSVGRMEAFSDGVLAIVITVMVLELKVPTGDDLAALGHSTGSGLLTYLISFIYIGIYWNNHHHMFQLTEQVTGSTLWANLHLLFWLSLLPFTTAWVDGTGFARTPVTIYGVNLLAAGLAYVVLQRVIIRFQGPDSALRQAIGRDSKAKVSLLLYLVGIGGCGALGGVAAPSAIVAAMVCFVVAPVLWLIPDRRITRVIAERPAGD
jgi:TMEM175 potassium channel family protein